jgi:hypothetical protein
VNAMRPERQGIPRPRSVRKVRSVRRCSMRLPIVCLAALRFTLALAVILLFSSNALPQHSAGGGGSSGGGSASGGGGGSHGGSSGGSVSSGSSAGSSSSGSSSHSSSVHSSSSAPASSQSGVRGTQPNTSHSILNQNTEVQKRSFFSFLWHPFRRPEPAPAPTVKPVADLRRPVCFKGPCAVCPTRGCGGAVIASNITRRPCGAGEFRNGGACLQQTSLDDCSGLRMMMERQAQRVQATEALRQSACSTDPQQCSASTSSAESEAGFYRALQQRYQACRRRSPMALPFSGFRVGGYSTAVSFESVR